METPTLFRFLKVGAFLLTHRIIARLAHMCTVQSGQRRWHAQ